MPNVGHSSKFRNNKTSKTKLYGESISLLLVVILISIVSMFLLPEFSPFLDSCYVAVGRMIATSFKVLSTNYTQKTIFNSLLFPFI